MVGKGKSNFQGLNTTYVGKRGGGVCTAEVDHTVSNMNQ